MFLDCGAYEKTEFDINAYCDRILDLQPSVVVVPDLLLCNWKVSWAYSIGMMEYILRRIKGEWTGEFMFVPQAEENDAKGFTTCLLNGLDHGFKWVGLPRAMNTHIFKLKLARAACAEMLKAIHPEVRVHALGWGGWLGELDLLAKNGVYSWDSSAPIWRGWCGFSLEEDHWPDYKLDLNRADLSSLVNEIVLKNLEACGVDTSKVRG